MTVGERIKERRNKLRLSQSQLAFKIDSDTTYISRWETGRARVSQKYILKLAQALETSTDYLLGETDDPTPVAPVKAMVPTPAIPDAPSDCSGRLVIRQGDLYINLPDTPEGYSALRAFLDTRGINGQASVPQNG